MLFKYGSGTGSNLSTLRSSREKLAGGGTASGPLSFMKGYDAFAGVIKSGGKTRRAAKMVILNASIRTSMDFIDAARRRRRRRPGRSSTQGYDGPSTARPTASVFFQNANISVRVTDEFMKAAVEDGAVDRRARCPTGGRWTRYAARELFASRSPRRRTCAAIRACSSTPRSTAGTPARTRRASTPPTRAASTCSSTTRPATWRR